MTSLNISLPDALRAWVEEKARKEGYGTASELVCGLILDAQKRAAEEKLEALALEGLDSGPGFEMTEEHWERLRARVVDRLASQRKDRP